jgi:hypothetical protein
MNGDRRRLGVNLLIAGIIIFVIGTYSDIIIDWIYERNGDIRIVGWGWVLQLGGGLLAIYGFMIYLEEYLAAIRPPPHPEMPQPYPLPPPFFMDRETKKVIWLLLIAALVMLILSPGFQCQTMFIIILVFAIIFFIIRVERWPYYPYPPPYYPPPQTQYPSPSAERSISPKAGKVKLCERCYAQLELDWTVCPFCGHSISPKPVDKND